MHHMILRVRRKLFEITMKPNTKMGMPTASQNLVTFRACHLVPPMQPALIGYEFFMIFSVNLILY